ncbi:MULTISPECIES: AMP-binding protein [unclassified Sphingomonas]|uniref:AMP-binding protein n=1 Tax=unclassified Sphingomonas TaxID=196159 RepID=UPI0006F4A7B9|nr:MULTISPECIES: AMP-binding protein [unclassified Sphingomonas]KQX18761.1 AMP-dependent synthetase [Sphingomonas sp. Root1294]KQY71915.1 AMP-dependent synthetase [Sphingomonas sp. Root50]KRB94820.1 AMP-dependent synthetase [Sphingomonas sp. Root720]
MRYAAADWVANYARTRPDAVALHNFDTDETRSWAQLESRVGQIAHALRERLGLVPGDRIVNISDGDLRHFELQFACARAGLVWVPLNFRHTSTELARACTEMAPKLMLTDAVWGETARQVARDTAIPNVYDWSPGGDFDALLDSSHAMGETEIDPDAPLQILYTSGTTGAPKAAIVTLGGMVIHALQQVEFCATAEPGGHLFQPMPLFHFGGLNTASNPILFFGGRVTIARRFDAAATTAYCGDPANAVTHLCLPPVMYQMMADSDPFAAADFSTLRRFICGGGRVSERLRAAYDPKGARFVPQYGGTEMGPVTSMNADRLDKIMAGSCGQKALHIDMRIVDEKGEDVARGEPGEVWVRGPGVTIGYLDATATIRRNDGWHRTGDVLWQDEEGFCFVVDRVKDMYKSGGENVFSAEVEGVLMTNPAVAECAVIGVPDARWGEVGLAIVVASNGHEVTLEALQASCEGKLARYKHPKHLRIVESFPRNVTGKIAKPALRAEFGGSRSV